MNQGKYDDGRTLCCYQILKDLDQAGGHGMSQGIMNGQHER